MSHPSMCKRCGQIDYHCNGSICRDCMAKTPEQLARSRQLAEQFRENVRALIEVAIVAGADPSDLQDALADLGYGEHVVIP